MQKRDGETLVKILIAFVIILIAVSISIIASTTIVQLRIKAKNKFGYLDIVYYQAEGRLFQYFLPLVLTQQT